MGRISVPDVTSATGAVAEAHSVTRKAMGGALPNLFAAVGAFPPDVLKAYIKAEEVLGEGTHDSQDVETIKLIVSELKGCDYCVGAHVKLGKTVGLSPESLKQNHLFAAPAEAWSLGPSAVVNLHGGGKRRALNERARAAAQGRACDGHRDRRQPCRFPSSPNRSFSVDGR
jgi:AhpD family alkylhydroperoxidase